MKEEWKKIEDIYSISNFGNVKNRTTRRILKPFVKGRKVVVGIYLPGGKQKQISIATLVAKTFINPNVKKVVRIDGNIWNNNLENLKVYL
jgi:hypothetical protein